MRLEDLTPGSALAGLEPSAITTIVAVVPIAEGAVQVIYKTPEGALKERMLGRADEDNTVEGPYYLRNPFDQEPGWGVASVNFDLGELLRCARGDFSSP